MKLSWKSAARGLLIGLLLGVGWLWFTSGAGNQAAVHTVVLQPTQNLDYVTVGRPVFEARYPTTSYKVQRIEYENIKEAAAKTQSGRPSRDEVLGRLAGLQQARSGALSEALTTAKKINDDRVKADTLITLTSYCQTRTPAEGCGEGFFKPLLASIDGIKAPFDKFRALRTFISTLEQAVERQDGPETKEQTWIYATQTIQAIGKGSVGKLDDPVLKSSLLVDVASALTQLSVNEENANEAMVQALQAAERAPAEPRDIRELLSQLEHWLHSLPLGLGLLFAALGLFWPHFTHGFFVAIGESFIHVFGRISSRLEAMVTRAVKAALASWPSNPSAPTTVAD